MVSTGNCIKWRNFISFKTRSRCFLFFDKGMITMELRVLKYFLEELYPQDLYIDSWESIEEDLNETLIIFTKALNIYKEDMDANR